MAPTSRSAGFAAVSRSAPGTTSSTSYQCRSSPLLPQQPSLHSPDHVSRHSGIDRLFRDAMPTAPCGRGSERWRRPPVFFRAANRGSGPDWLRRPPVLFRAATRGSGPDWLRRPRVYSEPRPEGAVPSGCGARASIQSRDQRERFRQLHWSTPDRPSPERAPLPAARGRSELQSILPRPTACPAA
jgi:hypothetical protein